MVFYQNGLVSPKNVILNVVKNLLNAAEAWGQEILHFVQDDVLFVRDDVLFVQDDVLFVQDDVLFVRDDVLFVRDDVYSG